MTGLFARLSARVGGGDGAPSPALRPRLSSRFEHESSSSLDDHDPALEGDGVAAAGQAASPSPRPSPLAGDRPPIHEAGSGQAATRSHAEDRVPQSDGPVRPQRRSAREEAAPFDPAASRRHTSVAVDPDGPGPRAVKPVVHTAHGADMPTATAASRAGRGPALSPSPPAPTPTLAPAPAASEHYGPRRRPETEEARTSMAPRPRRDQATATSMAAAAAGAPAIVHVTIGRIEVRATTPSAQTPRPPAPSTEPAVTTLDAYLRRRARQQA